MRSLAIIPAYNEEKSIAGIIRKTKKYVNKIIVIDDGSKDKTAKIAKGAGAEVISFKTNRGKGCALRLGFKRALKLKPKFIITLDSDGQHKPEDIPRFLENLEKYDMVIGSRFLGKIRTSNINIFGNTGLKFGVNLLSFGLNFDKWLTDTESGYRGYKYDSLKKLDLRGNRFEIEAEIILEAARNNLKIKEIPIIVPVAIKGITVRDGIKNAAHVTKRWLFG